MPNVIATPGNIRASVHASQHIAQINNLTSGIQLAMQNGVPAQTRPVMDQTTRQPVRDAQGQVVMQVAAEACTADEYISALGSLAPRLSAAVAMLNVSDAKLAQIQAVLAASE